VKQTLKGLTVLSMRFSGVGNPGKDGANSGGKSYGPEGPAGPAGNNGGSIVASGATVVLRGRDEQGAAGANGSREELPVQS
jgi:hypothetical protein